MSEQLFERLQGDMKTAMKAREKEKLGVLRMLISKVKDAAIDDPAAKEDASVESILTKYAKQRLDGAEEARKAEREDLVASEQAEYEMVKAYLPEALSDEELETLVTEVIAAEGASSMKDMGKVVKACMAQAGARAEGGRVSAVVKQKLAR